MSLWSAIRAKETWIGAAAVLLAAVVMIAVGAWLIVKGIVPQTSEDTWLLGSCALAGMLGAWIASKNGTGTILRTLILWLAVITVLWLLSLLLGGDMKLRDGGWKLSLAIGAGCLTAGIVRAVRQDQGGRRRRKRRKGTRIAARR